MRLVIKWLTLFLFGGAAYALLETCWRGYTHWSMFCLGGALFLIIGGLNETALKWDTPLIRQGLIGALIVTIAELIAGLILNVWLGLGVWDYSKIPLNLFGQICLPFSILWVPVSVFAIVLDDYLRFWLFGEERPTYTLLKGRR